MNAFNKLLIGALSLLTFAACSDDLGPNEQDKNQGQDGPSVYMGVNFYMPGMGGGRSYTDGDNTSSGGTEEGTSLENNVNEVLLILARPSDYGFIGAATVMADNLHKHLENGGSTYHATAKFNKSDLGQYYSDSSISPKGPVAVFIIANPSGDISTLLENAEYGDTKWINAPTSVNVNLTTGQTEGAIWSTTNGGSFLMSNSSIAIRYIPTMENAWDNFTSEDKCFNLSSTNDQIGAEIIDNSSDNNRGAVKVERAAARFDFRDGSPSKDRTYHVVYIDSNNNGEIDEDEKVLIDIRLDKMCLVNMNNQFYYFKRVSNNGLPTGADFKICGAEKPWYTMVDGSLDRTLEGNYVVDWYAEEKKNGIETGFNTYFNYAFFDPDGTFNADNLDAVNRWYVSQISDVLGGSETDNWANPNMENKTGTYHVWRYATENTIPGIDSQKNGISTGIVFKGKMQANNELLVSDEDLAAMDPNSLEYKAAEWNNLLINSINNKDNKLGDSNTDPVLYAYAGSLYVTWENIRQAAINASFSYTFDPEGKVIPDWNRTNSLYKAVFGNGVTGYELKNNDGEVIYTDEGDQDENSANAAWKAWKEAGFPSASSQLNINYKKAVTASGITIYQSSNDNRSGWGYYCYYFYWNRHDDNGKDGIMGPMEFAVVRNNVYKLAVTEIKKLGHPRLSTNDPENPTPNTDDEISNVYLTVDAEVIPWTVRVNDIVFK